MQCLRQADNWHRRRQVHLLRGPTLAQRLLHLRSVQQLAGRQGLHHRRCRHSLPRMRESTANGAGEISDDDDKKKERQLKTLGSENTNLIKENG